MSKLKLAKRVVTSKAARTVLRTKKNSPTLLFVAGTVGIVSSGVLVHKAARRYDDVIAVHDNKIADARRFFSVEQPDFTESEGKKVILDLRLRKCVAVGKLYSPAIALALLSFGALASGHVILSNRNAQLLAAYAALDRTHKAYRARVVNELGEEKDREFLFGLEDPKADENGVVDPNEQRALSQGTPSGYARIFDETTPPWQPNRETNMTFLRGQQQFANDLLWAQGHLFLNDVYKQLGFPVTSAGQQVGWVVNNPNGSDNMVDFGLFDSFRQDENENAIFLDFNVDGIVLDLIDQKAKTTDAPYTRSYNS